MGVSKVSLWQKLEERGREELKLGRSWYLYAVDLDRNGYGWAVVNFARKDENGHFKTSDSAFGNIKYFDLTVPEMVIN